MPCCLKPPNPDHVGREGIKTEGTGECSIRERGGGGADVLIWYLPFLDCGGSAAVMGSLEEGFGVRVEEVGWWGWGVGWRGGVRVG